MALPVQHRGGRERAPARWDPFRELEEMQARTQQLLESAWAGDGEGGGPAWVPAVDIEETEDAWILEAELPGVKPDNIDVEVRDNELDLTGEIVERERRGILRRRTRRTGRFEFRATLPGPIDPSSIDARAEDGVVTVRVPKPEETRPRRVEVRSGG